MMGVQEEKAERSSGLGPHEKLQGWKKTTVGECFHLEPGFAFKSADFRDNGVPVIKIKNVKAGFFSEHDFDYVDPSFVEQRPAKVARFDDLLISMSGNRHDGSPETWVGKVAPYRSHAIYLINQRVGALRAKDKGVIHPRYAGFLLSSWPFQQNFIAVATSSGGQANLSPNQILSVQISLPPIEEQSQIASLLGLLDDKIELNRRMNEALERQAQAIFRDWFVDFGPVRRAQAGATDPVAIMGGLIPDPARAAQIAALFPAAFGNDGLPVGWSEAAIGDLAQTVGGSTPSTGDESLWSPGLHYWATPKDLSGMNDLALFDTGRQISDAGLAKITSGLLPVGSVLLSSRAPIGYLAIAQVPVAINQGFIGLLPSAEIGSAFLYCWCKANMDKVTANANGSTFQEISKKNFRPITSPVPPNRELIAAFGEIADPLFARIVSAAQENRTLAETRDYLLPRLMSGAVLVASQAEAA